MKLTVTACLRLLYITTKLLSTYINLPYFLRNITRKKYQNKTFFVLLQSAKAITLRTAAWAVPIKK